VTTGKKQWIWTDIKLRRQWFEYFIT